MEIKIKSMKYEDFNDNEALEQLKAHGTNVIMGCLDDMINWARSNSVWPLTFATSCCGIEFMAIGAAPGAEAVVRPDGRTEVRGGGGRLRHVGGTVQKLVPRGKGHRLHHPGGRVHPRLPAPAGGVAIRHDATATENQGGEVLRRKEQEREENGVTQDGKHGINRST